MQGCGFVSRLRWKVYILKCGDGSFYTGVSTDIERRVYEHNNTSKASKYTRSRRPVSLVWTSDFMDKSSAHKLECRIKSLNRKRKEELVASCIGILNNNDSNISGRG